jgi:hypothetical protein
VRCREDPESGPPTAGEPQRADNADQAENEKRDGRSGRCREQSRDSKRHDYCDDAEGSTRHEGQAASEQHDPVETLRVHATIMAGIVAGADVSRGGDL